MPRVLHVLAQRPGRTGSGVTLQALVRQAAQAGWEQHVVVGVPSDDEPESWALPDMPAESIHPLRFGTVELPFAVPGMSDVMPYPATRFRDLDAARITLYENAWRRHLLRVIDSVQPELVHAHHVWLTSALVKDVAPDLPVVNHCHATGLRQMQLCPHLAPRVRAGCARNERFLALTGDHVQALTRALGIPAERVTRIGAGYREELFHPPSDSSPDAAGPEPMRPPSIAFIGKLSRSKGLPVLLDAFATLHSGHPELSLHVAGSGSGPEGAALRDRVVQQTGVRYHGVLSQAQVASLLRGCRVLALPSFYEGLPLVLVEARACGCRLVATDLPGIRSELAPELGRALTLVAQPPMLAIDTPDPAALPRFQEELETALQRSVFPERFDQPEAHGSALPRGDLAAFTWSAVFRRVESTWRATAMVT